MNACRKKKILTGPIAIAFYALVGEEVLRFDYKTVLGGLRIVTTTTIYSVSFPCFYLVK